MDTNPKVDMASTNASFIKLPPSRTEAVVAVLRADILAGKRHPGQRLHIDELANQFGVSRMPVRDALKQLESEGLVRIYAHRGVEVSTLDKAEIEELFGMRIILEQKSVELAIPRLTPAEHSAMKTILTRMDGLKGRNSEWIHLNARFHGIINQACGWPKLLALIQTLRGNVQRYVNVYIQVLGTEVPQAQHWALYNACVAGEHLEAKEVVARHLGTTATELITAISTTGLSAEFI